ncbi:hypothetical protein C7271_12790, partial [filamentous cyanobacterium CCP5]
DVYKRQPMEWTSADSRIERIDSPNVTSADILTAHQAIQSGSAGPDFILHSSNRIASCLKGSSQKLTLLIERMSCYTVKSSFA